MHLHQHTENKLVASEGGRGCLYLRLYQHTGSHIFTFALMMTGALKFFSKLKLVTDNLPFHLCRSQLRSH